MCLLTTSPTPCDHAECKSPMCCFVPQPQFPEPAASSALLMLGMRQLNQVLLTMAGQSAEVQRYLDKIAANLTTYRKSSACDLEFRVPDDRCYRARLGVMESVSQAFKERGFCLRFQVLASDGSARRTSGIRFKVNLYSQETPPKRILQNIAGKKILRGTVEAESDSEGVVQFPNIVVNEVSSHYINDAFYLVIMPTSPDIQPFTLTPFSVRARKPMKRLPRPCDLQDFA